MVMINRLKLKPEMEFLRYVVGNVGTTPCFNKDIVPDFLHVIHMATHWIQLWHILLLDWTNNMDIRILDVNVWRRSLEIFTPRLVGGILAD
jgi:hypothetical protein